LHSITFINPPAFVTEGICLVPIKETDDDDEDDDDQLTQ